MAGTSLNGLPVHHVRYGEGSVKALFVAFPHCMEPIGGLTVYSLLTMLRDGVRELTEADVEWHVIPCVDPDGAILNEGWTQHPFALHRFLKNYFVQSARYVVDGSFPIKHKSLAFDDPTPEAIILRDVLTEVRPDFFFSLHNAWPVGGGFFYVNHDIGQSFYSQMHQLLERFNIPLRASPPHREYCAEFAPGILEPFSARKLYDYLEATTESPAAFMPYGAGSWDHLEDIKPDAITFVAETGYMRHPSDGSRHPTNYHLRHLKLRADADNKFLGTLLLETWEKVEKSLNRESPFYRTVTIEEMPSVRGKLLEGVPPISVFPTRDLLFNSSFAGVATEGDVFSTLLYERFPLLTQAYLFVRLLKASEQTPAVVEAVASLELVLSETLSDLNKVVDFDAFDPIPYDTLASVQLGSGLIALNSVVRSNAG